MVKHEYAFDVALRAVVRVKADSEAQARQLLDDALDCVDFTPVDAHPAVEITEGSLTTTGPESADPELFEVDGKRLPLEG